MKTDPHQMTIDQAISNRPISHGEQVGWDEELPPPAPNVYEPVRARNFERDQVLVVVDARHACYRAYYTRELSSSAGEVTSCLHGVLEMTRSICEAANTRRWVLCWDGNLDYKRRLHPVYKKRHDRSLTLEEQEERIKREKAIAMVKEFMDRAGAPSIHIEDAEADDAAGIAATMWSESLAARKVCKDPKVILLTDDKDYYQLIGPRIMVWRGVMRQLVDEAAFVSLHGFSPPRYADYKALVGEPETGDNIPGIAKVGHETACKLIGTHGTIYNVIAYCERQVAEVKKPRVIELNINKGRADALLSLRLSSIARTVADLKVLGCDAEKAEAAVKKGLNLACKTSRPVGDVKPVLAKLGFVSLDFPRWLSACGFAGG